METHIHRFWKNLAYRDNLIPFHQIWLLITNFRYRYHGNDNPPPKWRPGPKNHSIFTIFWFKKQIPRFLLYKTLSSNIKISFSTTNIKHNISKPWIGYTLFNLLKNYHLGLLNIYEKTQFWAINYQKMHWQILIKCIHSFYLLHYV